MKLFLKNHYSTGINTSAHVGLVAADFDWLSHQERNTESTGDAEFLEKLPGLVASGVESAGQHFEHPGLQTSPDSIQLL